MSPIPRCRATSLAPPQTRTRGWPPDAVADLDVGPGDPPAPAGPDRLEDRLLRRPSAGEVLDRVLARLAVADLALGVDPAQEQLAVLLDHLADARALDDVGADPQDFHAPSASERVIEASATPENQSNRRPRRAKRANVESSGAEGRAESLSGHPCLSIGPGSRSRYTGRGHVPGSLPQAPAGDPGVGTLDRPDGRTDSPPSQGWTPMDLLADLTPAQREAVTHVDGPLLVLAGAGSGKTRVITRRVAYLLGQGIAGQEHPGADLHQQGGRRDAPADRGPGARGGRLGRHVPQPLRPAAPHLRPAGRARPRLHDLRPGRPPPRRQAGDGAARPRRRDRHPRADRRRDQPGQERPGRPRGPRQAGRDHVDAVVAKVYRAYQERLRESSAVDFDDLLVHMVTILKEHPDVRAELDARFRYVLVDEYQDTNLAQYAIVRALSVDHPNLCVTGDPDQSIYGWRGANLSNILEFEHDFPGCRVVKLERNYRSTKNILRVADHLIRFNRRRKPKALTTENPERRAGRADRLPDRDRRGARRRLEDRRAGPRGGIRLRRHRRLLPGDGPDPQLRAGASGRRRSPTRSSAASRSTSGRRSRTSWPT